MVDNNGSYIFTTYVKLLIFIPENCGWIEGFNHLKSTSKQVKINAHLTGGVQISLGGGHWCSTKGAD